MTKEELITNQCLDIASLRQMHERNEKTINMLKSRFINIGCPINDNLLNFDKKQIEWCLGVLSLIEEIEY